MPFLAGIGVAVAGAFGATAIGVTAATVIGGAIVGAAVGGLYAAISGGNILKGVLFGAVGGAVVGFGVGALGFGGAAAGSSISTGVGGGAASGTIVSGPAAGSMLGGGTSAIGGAGAAGWANPDAIGLGAQAGGWFTSANVQAAGAVATLGSGFLKGGMAGEDVAAAREIAEKKMENDYKIAELSADTQLAAAEMAAESSAARNETQKEIAAADREFSKEKFEKEFGESVFRDRDDREIALKHKEDLRKGISEASTYMAGATQVPDLVQNNLRRKTLPSPNWYTGNPVPQQQAEQQAQPPQNPGLIGAA